MKVAIVHYHLRRGGISRAIHSAQKALRDLGFEVLIISGEAPEAGLEFDNLEIIPGLNYRKTAYQSVAEGLKDALEDRAEAHFGCQPDVWHFHNHSLGKNVLLPLVTTGLAEDGAHLLLQIHDFPEDGRSQNYVAQKSFFDLEKEFSRTLYPRASHVHYATINRRDWKFLKTAGMKPEQLHLLPDAVTGSIPEATPGDRPFSRDKKFLLYPTRASRRKNLGELMLLAHAYGDEFDFATSLVPENTDFLPIHRQWEGLAEEFELPVTFGIGQDVKYRFDDLVGWSDAMVNTSVAEGFGLAFLEPWLFGKCVVGRNLPRITSDFDEAGIALNHLYDRIGVPLSWVGESSLRKEADRLLRQIYLAYNRPIPKNAVDLAISRWVHDDFVDFGMLNEDYQTAIIRKAVSDPGALGDIDLPRLTFCSPEEIRWKAELVRNHYSLASYGELLTECYEKVARSRTGRVSSHSPRKILDQFLDPWRLNMLRT